MQLKCPGHREEDTALAQDSRACGPVGQTDVAGSNASCCCGLNAGLSHEVRVTAHSMGLKLWKFFRATAILSMKHKLLQSWEGKLHVYLLMLSM